MGLVRARDRGATSTAPLVRATSVVRHRGPDDEGYFLWEGAPSGRAYAGADTAAMSRARHSLHPLPPHSDWRVALGHRRLSIVDLSSAGHQPMIHEPSGLVLCYNGEIYNHVELRRELEHLGHHFISTSDSEVLLAAWAEWDADCLSRFNGMFAFLLFDPRRGGSLHAVRDRFGVKPLYWARCADMLAFSSEVKQLRSLPAFVARVDRVAVRDFLSDGIVDHGHHTFDESIQQLMGGERAVVRLGAADPAIEIHRWYSLRPSAPVRSLSDAAEHLRELLTDSVRLRLRADVPIGSCLSGGLDSSAIVALVHRTLAEHGEHAGQATVTARFAGAQFDEWQFAEQVVQATGAMSIQVWPTFDRLERELRSLAWHMDEPFTSTSMFSQWCVFGAAADAGLVVMLDGQGSDEQLAGYPGNDGALYAGQLRDRAFLRLLGEARSFRDQHGAAPLGQLVYAAQIAFPPIVALLPAHWRAPATGPDWMRTPTPSRLDATPPEDLEGALRRQLLSTSLPSLLRYEDRNSMARSVESRVPFLDYRLVELVAGLPSWMKLSRGVTKVALREAMAGIVPEAVRVRRDKMGFVTPEQRWVTGNRKPWFRREIASALDLAADVVDVDRLRVATDSVLEGTHPFTSLPWRVVSLGLWLAMCRSPVAAPGETSGAVVV
ncbi:MAG: asparagine synthase (glutamine-hydrolyzing) [Gemmatimonadota bacterium]|nr:asparagine synthase (glutamine-hydrolyzing) [Gemmatimonadota bacterium]